MATESDWSHVNAVIYAGDYKRMDEAYTKFAPVYDANMASLGSLGNQNIITVAYKYVKNDESSLMLDIAAGTGWTAHYFKEAGFKGQIDGIEMNSAMLDQAIAKGLYRKTFCMEVKGDEPLPVKDGSYDVVTSAGAFLYGHLPSGCIKYLLNALKSGGHLIFNCRITPRNKEYRSILTGYLEQMIKDKKIEILEKEETPMFETGSTESREAQNGFVFVYRKL